jgi:nucleotide-binding universal stress UspA family protein
MYKKIVVGYDGSDRALRAVEEAGDLATATGAVLHLVTAVQKQNPIHEFGESSDKMFLSETQLANEQLLNLAAKMKHLDVRVGAVRGAPAQVLLDEARRVNADLILVGNRNVQGLSRILGSVAEDVAHKAPCAVLIAKTA